MFTETSFENVVIDYLKELDYEYAHGSELVKEDKEVLLLDRLKQALIHLNPSVPISSLSEAIRVMKNFDTNDVFTNNKTFHQYLTEGIEISDFIDGKTKYYRVNLIDYDNPSNNDFLVVNQLEITEDGGKKIPDVFVYINGIPLIVMELKSTSREEVTIEDAYKQLMNYKNVHIPSLFYYNAFLVISDGVETKAGTITASFDRFMSWKKVNPEDDSVMYQNRWLESLMFGLFHQPRLLDVIKNFILFTPKAKIMAQYHQYYGMKKAIASCERAVSGDGRAGVIWHTQGSGKSFSMTFLAGNLVKSHVLNNPTLLVITDRNDLDGQLFETFKSASDFLRQTPVRMDSRQEVKDFLGNRHNRWNRLFNDSKVC